MGPDGFTRINLHFNVLPWCYATFDALQLLLGIPYDVGLALCWPRLLTLPVLAGRSLLVLLLIAEALL